MPFSHALRPFKLVEPWVLGGDSGRKWWAGTVSSFKVPLGLLGLYLYCTLYLVHAIP